MRQTLDFGKQIDMLTKGEFEDALAEDAKIRAIITGVKPVEVFIPTSIIGPGVAVYSTSGNPPVAPASGYIWAVMAVGLDLSAGSALNVYKGTPSAVGQGGRAVIHNASTNVQLATFSKGQLWIRPGDQLTFIVAAASILSVFMNVIEIPAERVGELLI